MKTTLICLALLGSAALADDAQTVDLGNGTTIEIRDGKVSLKNSGPGSGGWVSQSSHTDASGSTVTRVTTERNGQRSSRTVVVGPDGKVSVSGDDPANDPPDRDPADEQAGGGWLGVHTVPLVPALRAQLEIPEGQGIVIEFIAEEGPAAKAGLEENDIILTLDGKPVRSVEAFRQQLRESMPGASAVITYLRKGKEDSAVATLGERPVESPPGDAVTREAERLLREMLDRQAPGRRSVVVESDGSTRVVESDDGDAFDLLLDDPNVPESIKEQIRKAREELRKAQRDAPDGEKPDE
jgi:membrane-associated protease RseP (regulator of RpoE activity)